MKFGSQFNAQALINLPASNRDESVDWRQTATSEIKKPSEFYGPGRARDYRYYYYMALLGSIVWNARVQNT